MAWNDDGSWDDSQFWNELASQRWIDGGDIQPPQPPPLNPTLVKSAGNPRYFAKPGGPPIYFTGAYGWSDHNDILVTYNGIQTPPGTPYPPVAFAFDSSISGVGNPNYIDWAVSQGYTYCRYWLEMQSYEAVGRSSSISLSMMPFARPGPGNAADNLPKYDVNTFNQAYFDRIRARCIAAQSAGIYVAIVLFDFSSMAPGWAWHPFNVNNNINGFDADPANSGAQDSMYTLAANQAATLTKQQAFVKKVIDTVNDLDNVLFEIINEGPAGTAAWQQTMIDYIHNYEATLAKQHPVGMTGGSGRIPPSTYLNSSADWISPDNNVAPWPGLWSEPPENTNAITNGKIAILDLDHIWPAGQPGNTAQIGAGQWCWKCFLRGYNVIALDDLYGLGIAGVWRAPWGANYQPYRRAQAQTARYAKRCNLNTAVPNSALSSTRYCLADPGRQYLVLRDASRGSFVVNLSDGAGKSFSVEWLNVADDLVQTPGNIAGGSAAQSFTSPFAQPSVLFLNESQVSRSP